MASSWRFRRRTRFVPGLTLNFGANYPDFELGAVPPVGGARRDPVIVEG
jgi:hypothetical protein